MPHEAVSQATIGWLTSGCRPLQAFHSPYAAAAQTWKESLCTIHLSVSPRLINSMLIPRLSCRISGMSIHFDYRSPPYIYAIPPTAKARGLPCVLPREFGIVDSVKGF